MGGAFGGKEVQANPWAAIAALGAWKTRRPVRVRLTRELDMALTGKRHPVSGALRGRLRRRRPHRGAAARALLRRRLEPRPLRADHVAVALPLRQRLPPAGGRGHRPRLPHAQDVADGVPRLRRAAGMLVIEEILSQAAQRLVAARRRGPRAQPLSRGRHHALRAGGRATPARLATIWDAAEGDQRLRRAPRRTIARFNAAHPHVKRGLAITPVKFGISFTATFFNQGGALVLIYRDGSVQVNHGGTEMGQGLFTKIQQIAADGLGVPLDRVRVMPTRTDKVPNTSATAASAGTDLNGAAVVDACAQIMARLDRWPPAARLRRGRRRSTTASCRRGRSIAFATSARRRTRSACRSSRRASTARRTSTSTRRPAAASRSTTSPSAPRCRRSKSTASPAHYRLLRTDILQDVGDSISPVVDRGQIEGGFIQGVGWLTIEELLWDARGPAWRPAARPPTSCRRGRRCPTSFEVDFLRARDAAGRRLRQQGRRRAAADAGDLGARSDPRRRRGVRRRRRRHLRQPGHARARLLRRPRARVRVARAAACRHRAMTPARELNALRPRPRFVDALGWVFEHSPWVAERAWAQRPFAVARRAARGDDRARSRRPTASEQLALLRAHPDLGDARAHERCVGRRAGGAGLDRLTRGRVRAAAAAERRLPREVRLPVPARGEGQHVEHDVLRGARTARSPTRAATRSSPEALRQVSRIARFGWTICAGMKARSDRSLSRRPSGRPRSVRGAVRQRLEAALLRQGRRHRLSAESRRPDAGGVEPGVRRQRADARLRRRVLADLHHRRQHRPRRHRLDEELHPARDAELRRRTTCEDYCRFLGEKFLGTYPQVEGVQVSAVEIPYAALAGGVGASRRPGRSARPRASRSDRGRDRSRRVRASAGSGCCASAAARFTASCATSTRRCRTSPNRPLHMWLDLEWRYADPDAAFSDGRVAAAARPHRHATCSSRSSPAASSR